MIYRHRVVTSHHHHQKVVLSSGLLTDRLRRDVMQAAARALAGAAASLPVFVAINDVVVSVSPVGGRSMQPTLNPSINGYVPRRARSAETDRVTVSLLPGSLWRRRPGRGKASATTCCSTNGASKCAITIPKAKSSCSSASVFRSAFPRDVLGREPRRRTNTDPRARTRPATDRSTSPGAS